MIGLHVRNVFDAPRDVRGNASVEDAVAIDGARREYGADAIDELLQWRRASHWTNFVPRMKALMQAYGDSRGNRSSSQLHFYLAADSEDAYTGLMTIFPQQMVFTKRDCGAMRCDYRDCQSMLFSLIDLMNLARTRMILGSGYSSFSEVAAQLGGYSSNGEAIPILMAGRDFGAIVQRRRFHEAERWQMREEREVVDLAGFGQTSTAGGALVQRYWPKPF